LQCAIFEQTIDEYRVVWRAEDGPIARADFARHVIETMVAIAEGRVAAAA
jgi:hypothetical protein